MALCTIFPNLKVDGKYRGDTIHKYRVVRRGLYDPTDLQDELVSPIGWVSASARKTTQKLKLTSFGCTVTYS